MKFSIKAIDNYEPTYGILFEEIEEDGVYEPQDGCGDLILVFNPHDSSSFAEAATICLRFDGKVESADYDAWIGTRFRKIENRCVEIFCW